VPEEITFASKPELARAMIERTLAAGARPAWVVADAVYGGDGKLRFWLEEHEQPYVLAVTSKQSVCIGFEKRAAKSFLARLPTQAWHQLSAGAGAKGPRLFDWAALKINQPCDPRRWQRFLLLRRSPKDPAEIAFYLAFAPAGSALEVLARVAGRRWTIEESFAQSKSEVGLDQYEVRSSWTGWQRHMSLAMAAQALLALTRAKLFAKPAATTQALAAFKKSRGLLVAGS
jgi:SRSO17 transposase